MLGTSKGLGTPHSGWIDNDEHLPKFTDTPSTARRHSEQHIFRCLRLLNFTSMPVLLKSSNGLSIVPGTLCWKGGGMGGEEAGGSSHSPRVSNAS
ncbi:hypothetical protein EYR38_002567 [Pleurotus pulmonarius]|nr:hypothetical protein EYR38_002567 [Pleurotus pulmonarius]